MISNMFELCLSLDTLVFIVNVLELPVHASKEVNHSSLHGLLVVGFLYSPLGLG